MNKFARMMVAQAAMMGAMMGWDEDPTLSLPSKPVKKCLRCGREHTHNNSWCSAECAKLWREEKRNEPNNIH